MSLLIVRFSTQLLGTLTVHPYNSFALKANHNALTLTRHCFMKTRQSHHAFYVIRVPLFCSSLFSPSLVHLVRALSYACRSAPFQTHAAQDHGKLRQGRIDSKHQNKVLMFNTSMLAVNLIHCAMNRSVALELFAVSLKSYATCVV